MSKVLVFGHANPDTDSIASAISYAYLLNQTGLCRIAATIASGALLIITALRILKRLSRSTIVLKPLAAPAPFFTKCTMNKALTFQKIWLV